MKKTRFRYYAKNIIIPCLLFSLITGIFTALIILSFKWASSHVIKYSGIFYNWMKENPLYPLAILLVLVALAIITKLFYILFPDSKGGGIPTSIAILRGLITFKWLKNLIGVTVAALVTFFLGIPLGNEGPCVQMGTAVGRGVISTLGKKNKAWDKYVMTGGACAGFAVATNAPISGIMFAIEEAHQRLSPMIILVACASVSFASITYNLLSPLFNVSTVLFENLAPITLAASDMWIPLVIGVIIGLSSVAFLKLHKWVENLWSHKLSKVDVRVKYYVIFACTLVIGYFFFDMVGTGHHIIEGLLENNFGLVFIIAALIIRSMLGIFANNSGLTGGLFVPILAIGALFSAIIAELLTMFGVVGEEYYQIIILLGMTACLSGMIKTPVTAVIFAIEALSLQANIIPVMIVATLSFMMTEIFEAHSINERVIDDKLEELHKGKQAQVVDCSFVVQPLSFAVGKEVKDILWPNNFFVYSIKRAEYEDRNGQPGLAVGDRLFVKYTTYDQATTLDEIYALVGNQPENASVKLY